MKQQGFTALTALNPQSKVRDFSQGGKNLKSKLGALQCLLDRQKHTHTSSHAPYGTFRALW